MFNIKKSGVSVKEHPLKGDYEGNNDEAKATDNPYEINQSIGQEKEWEEKTTWVLGEVRGTCWIRAHGVPCWGVVVINAQLVVVGISGLLVKSARQDERWWTDLREMIGKG